MNLRSMITVVLSSQVADMFLKHVEVAPLSACAVALAHATRTGTDSTQVILSILPHTAWILQMSGDGRRLYVLISVECAHRRGQSTTFTSSTPSICLLSHTGAGIAGNGCSVRLRGSCTEEGD